MSKNVRKKLSTALLDEKKLDTSKPDSKEKKQKVKASFGNISPVLDISNNEFFEMRSGEYMEILQIESKDVYSLNPTDLYNDISNLSSFFISFADAIKIVPLNMPMVCEEQKAFLFKKIKKTNNAQYQYFLQKRIDELTFLENHRTNREYFIFIYHKDELKLQQAITKVKNALARSNPITKLSIEKKISVLFQLFNPSVKPLRGGDIC